MNRILIIFSMITLLAATCVEVSWARRHYRHRDRDVTININRGDHHHHRRHRGAVVAAGVTGLAVGAMIGAAASQPRTVVVQPGAIVPAYGSAVYSLPPGCVVTAYRNVQYYQCNGVYHQPVMGVNGVYYQVVPPPY